METLRARGYDVDTKKQLSESIKQEMRIQENLLANRKITVLLAKTKNNVFTVQRQMPSTEALIRNKKVMVRTLQDGEVLGAEGHVIARDSYTQLIRWVLSEERFHGKAAKADFHYNGFHYSSLPYLNGIFTGFPVLMRITSSKGKTKILPSPMAPVRACF